MGVITSFTRVPVAVLEDIRQAFAEARARLDITPVLERMDVPGFQDSYHCKPSIARGKRYWFFGADVIRFRPHETYLVDATLEWASTRAAEGGTPSLEVDKALSIVAMRAYGLPEARRAHRPYRRAVEELERLIWDECMLRGDTHFGLSPAIACQLGRCCEAILEADDGTLSQLRDRLQSVVQFAGHVLPEQAMIVYYG